jgi:RHS repeat-associated protein
VNATYTTEDDSYYGTLVHLKRATGESRFPLYDEIGSARGLVDASATVTDTYDMDTFGKPIASTGSTPNPYRFGAAWGYITDPSGFLQLGARYYWPEVGRFVQQDAIGEGVNWYAYARNNPIAQIDPSGDCEFPPPSPPVIRFPRLRLPDPLAGARRAVRRTWNAVFGEGGLLGPLPGHSKCKEAADKKRDDCMKQTPCRQRSFLRRHGSRAKCRLKWLYDRAKCEWTHNNPLVTGSPGTPDVIGPTVL